ncbi:anthranilate synthase component I family protein [Alicyclobacillus tolerans]|uniref:anthranilate synthase component I family protein n=1 Tax=Alicyclobacillus tolerans TaxID=90970 RepID=UPI001F233DE3|nr:anthranilate synthase component I family protein [Alicyclobacillus tolerans]MCF8566866.1 anthranilate synthase component I family protein [Alicyclobacillus tolerans]
MSVKYGYGTNLDPFYLFLDLVDEFGEGEVFLLDAAKETSSHYQMSLLGVLPLLEVQVKDEVVRIFAPQKLLHVLQARLSDLKGELNASGASEPLESAAMGSVIEGLPLVYCTSDPMALLERVRSFLFELHNGQPFVPFSSGLLGYFGYDAVHYLERLPKSTQDDRGLPDVRLQWHAVVAHLVDGQMVLHNAKHALAQVFEGQELMDWQNRIDGVEQHILASAAQDMSGERLAKYERDRVDTSSFHDDVSQAEFEAAVERAKEYVRAGDIFQVVLSKRMRVNKVIHPYVAYERLRKLNPSPYMFVAEYPGMRIFGASPEVQFRAVDNRAEMKPIAGTSKGRGKTPEEDALLMQRLQNDEKERAEHLMLVDLCRNDLGRVCRFGTVQVPEFMTVEPYSHLFHLVSAVHGELRDDVSVFHALLATFPAGTLSGAPKIRAMEIIDELENYRRGPYGGMLGMIDLAANANTAIVIRTVVEAHDQYYIQVGAGIVADSDPTQEWLECGHKAGAVLDVLLPKREQEGIMP